MEIASIVLSVLVIIVVVVDFILDFKNDKYTENKIKELEKQIEDLKKGE